MGTQSKPHKKGNIDWGNAESSQKGEGNSVCSLSFIICGLCWMQCFKVLVMTVFLRDLKL